MKYEIEVPNLPEGVRPVGYDVPSDSDYFLGSDYISEGPSVSVWLIVKPAEGYEFVKSDFGIINVHRIPRKRVRIEFDMPSDWESASHIWYETARDRKCVEFSKQGSTTIVEASDEN